MSDSYGQRLGSLLILAALLLTLCVTRCAEAAEVEPMFTYSHTSDILRGPPLNDRKEPQQDYLGFGATLRWRKVELDLSHGIKAMDCNYRQTSVTASGCRFESGTDLHLRYYPWRKR